MEPRSIILASGTLQPLDALEAELQVPFPIKLQNKHVIPDNQVMIQTVKQGSDGNLFKFDYSNRDNKDMFIELGWLIT